MRKIMSNVGNKGPDQLYVMHSRSLTRAYMKVIMTGRDSLDQNLRNRRPS